MVRILKFKEKALTVLDAPEEGDGFKHTFGFDERIEVF